MKFIIQNEQMVNQAISDKLIQATVLNLTQFSVFYGFAQKKIYLFQLTPVEPGCWCLGLPVILTVASAVGLL